MQRNIRERSADWNRFAAPDGQSEQIGGSSHDQLQQISRNLHDPSRFWPDNRLRGPADERSCFFAILGVIRASGC